MAAAVCGRDTSLNVNPASLSVVFAASMAAAGTPRSRKYSLGRPIVSPVIGSSCDRLQPSSQSSMVGLLVESRGSGPGHVRQQQCDVCGAVREQAALVQR